MKKVLIVLTGGLLNDGITLSLIDLLKSIKDDQLSIDVLNSNNASIECLNNFEKVDCNIIDSPNRKKKPIQYILFLNGLLKNGDYDVIHVHGSSYIMGLELFVAKMNGVPLRIAHSRNTKTNNKLLHMLFKGIFFSSYNYALACGNDAGRWLFGNRSFQIVHNGKNLEKFRYNEIIRKKIREKYNIGDNVLFGHVGNFNYQKNHSFLIDVFNDYHKKNSRSILMLVGHGPLEDDIKKKVSQLQLQDSVIFTGSVDNVYELLQGMDIMLFPSLFEGLPNVVLEWQAAGLMSLISDTITDECKVSDLIGFLPINQGTSEWISEIDRILEMNINRQKLSELGCQELAKHGFDIHESAEKIRKLYTS